MPHNDIFKGQYLLLFTYTINGVDLLVRSVDEDCGIIFDRGLSSRAHREVLQLFDFRKINWRYLYLHFFASVKPLNRLLHWSVQK